MVVRRMMKNRKALKRMRKLLAVGVLIACLAGMPGCAGTPATGSSSGADSVPAGSSGTGAAVSGGTNTDTEVSGATSDTNAALTAPVWSEMQPESSMELLYATQFSVDSYEGGYELIQIQDDGKYLVVPETMPVPEGVPDSITVLQKPLDHVYLAATSAMDLIAAIGRTDRITLSGTKESGWYVDAAKEAMKAGTLTYAGKYSAPDYEKILADGCDLAVESTMIYHTPDVKEQLTQLKIPVLVERSSYEEHPLGRMEWIRLYGVLFDEEEKAEQLFRENMEALDGVLSEQPTGKTAAFFYITSNGAVNVRKPGDYVAKMIELAGGSYVPQTASEEENALSTMNMQMETFYAEAKNADILIYNSTIDGELETLDQLLAKSPLLADFKAVKEGNVWCTGKNMFQETMGLGNMILDLHTVLAEENPAENYIICTGCSKCRLCSAAVGGKTRVITKIVLEKAAQRQVQECVCLAVWKE